MELFTFALTLFLGQVAFFLIWFFFGRHLSLWTLKNLWGVLIGLSWIPGITAIVVQNMDPNSVNAFQIAFAPYGLLVSFLSGLWFLYLSKLDSQAKTAPEKKAFMEAKWRFVLALLALCASLISALIMVVN